MDAPFVALDLGNRRFKAGWFKGTGTLERALSLTYDQVGSQWGPWLALGPAVGHAVSSVVCDPARATGIMALVEAELGLRVEVNPAPGLQMAVRSPETVGLDRLYAARAALARGLEAAVVVDVGTAMTVDVVTRATTDGASAGTFLGGAIAPGPELVAEALAGPEQLYGVSPRPDAPALGRDTRAALEAGVAHTVAGAALRLADGVRSESGLELATLVLTGGARGFVAQALA
ncbi:MAG: pantothenate kinase type III, partial [Chlamydiales bacterium]